LVRDVQSSACNRNRQQGSYRADGCPTCFGFLKTFGAQFPTGVQSQECRNDVPDENAQIKRKVRYADAGGNQFIKQGQAGVVEEKFGAKWIEVGIQELFDARKVDLCIFCASMITVRPPIGAPRRDTDDGSKSPHHLTKDSDSYGRHFRVAAVRHSETILALQVKIIINNRVYRLLHLFQGFLTLNEFESFCSSRLKSFR
jgi:hypothetical protein